MGTFVDFKRKNGILDRSSPKKESDNGTAYERFLKRNGIMGREEMQKTTAASRNVANTLVPDMLTDEGKKS